MNKKLLLILILVYSFLFLLPLRVFAQQNEESFKGVIADIKQVPCSEQFEQTYTCFQYTVKLSDSGKEEIMSPILSETGKSKFLEGDKVFVSF